ncbi:MAG: PAS domain S-box protein [Opitutaceae bacterium]
MAPLIPSDDHGRDRDDRPSDSSWIEADIRLMAALRAAVNQHADLAITDREGVILHVNERFCAISGYSRDELVGRDHRIVSSGFHPKSFFRDMWDTILDGRIWKGEVCNRAKDGGLYWLDTVIVPQLGPSGQVERFVAIRTDISRLKSAESYLRALNEDLDDRVRERTAELERARAQVDGLNTQLEARVADRTRQLQSASDQFRLLFEHAPLGVSWVEFGETDVYHLNDRFCEIIGLPKDKAQDFRNIQKVTHPEDRQRQIEFQEKINRGEIDRYSLEKRYIHADGEVVWANLTVAVLRGPDGRVAQQFAIINNITKRKQAEEKLAASERRFRAYVENASEILYALTLEGRFQYVSPAWQVKLGHSIDEVIGHFYEEFVHPEDLEICRKGLSRTLAEGRSPQSVEYRILHKDGTYRWHASSGSVVRDEQGNVLYFIGVGRDVTARKQSQEELRAALERRAELERIIEKSPSVVILWQAGEGWPVEFVSKNIRHFGYEVDELLSGRVSYTSIMHPEDRERVAREVHQFARRGIRDYGQHYRLVTRSGEIRWVDDRTILRVDESGRVTHHQGIITDVTERKEAEFRELERRENDLRMAAEIQHHMLPATVPHADEIEVESLYVPSSLLGGDYFDLFPIGDRKVGVVVADVSGKGASAALVMAAFRTALRMKAVDGDRPSVVLTEVNRSIKDDMPANMFISVVYGIMDLDSSEVTLVVAGHEPVIIWRGAEGRAELVASSTLAVGLDVDGLFGELLKETPIKLAASDTLILYTDGITEALNPEDEEFGRARFLETIGGFSGGSLSDLMRSVQDRIELHCSGRLSSDDRTLLLLRRRVPVA